MAMLSSTTFSRSPIRRSLRACVAAATLGVIAALIPSAAFASGSGGGGSGGGSGGGGVTACASVALLSFYNFGNGGNQRLVVQGNVTNCGTGATVYTMRASEIGTHADPLCAIKDTSYRLPSVAAGATQYWWQASGSGVCLTESYTIRVDVMAGTTVLASSIQSWN
jgi:hypothetical protein